MEAIVKMKSLYLEKVAPYLLALSGDLLWWRVGLAFPPGDDLLSSSLTLGAIITGFLATAKAILMTLDSPVMQRIRETNYVNDLVSYLGQAIWLSFGFCAVSIVGFFSVRSELWYGLLWVFFGLASAASFVRVTNIMLKIIKHPPS